MTVRDVKTLDLHVNVLYIHPFVFYYQTVCLSCVGWDVHAADNTRGCWITSRYADVCHPSSHDFN